MFLRIDIDESHCISCFCIHPTGLFVQTWQVATGVIGTGIGGCEVAVVLAVTVVVGTGVDDEAVGIGMKGKKGALVGSGVLLIVGAGVLR